MKRNTDRDALNPGEPVAWMYEDELPASYPYNLMYPYSKVDGVRMFPVFAPIAQQSGEPVAWRLHPFDYGIGHEGVYAMTNRPEQVAAWERKGWTVEPLYTAAQTSSTNFDN